VLGAPLDIQFQHATDRIRKGIGEMFGMALEGKLRPHIMASFPLEQFHEAFALIQNRTAKGKIATDGSCPRQNL